MQADAVLLEAFLLEFLITAARPNGHARAHVIEKILAVVYLGHIKLRQQATVKTMRLLKLGHGKTTWAIPLMSIRKASDGLVAFNFFAFSGLRLQQM